MFLIGARNGTKNDTRQATHGKQIIDLAVLRIMGVSLLSNYSEQYGYDTRDQIALLLDLIDARGNTAKAVTEIKQVSETYAYIQSLPV